MAARQNSINALLTHAGLSKGRVVGKLPRAPLDGTGCVNNVLIMRWKN